MMKKILVPCDFSERSDEVLNYAVSLAQMLKADICLLNIQQYPVLTPEVGMTAYTYQDAEKDSLEALHKLRNRIMLEMGFANKVECFTEMGDTSDVVTKYIKEKGADLTIMGVHGHGNHFLQRLMGSNAVSVSQHTDGDVLIVPPGSTFHSPHTILFACEYEETVQLEPGFIKVTEFAKVFNAEVLVLHVLTEKKGGHFPKEDNYYLHEPGAPYKTFMVHETNAAKGILNFVRDHSIDIVAIEPKKHSFFHHLLNKGITNEIAFNSNVPVLTVH